MSKQGEVTSRINQQDHIRPQVFFPSIVTLKDPTEASFLYMFNIAFPGLVRVLTVRIAITSFGLVYLISNQTINNLSPPSKGGWGDYSIS